MVNSDHLYLVKTTGIQVPNVETFCQGQPRSKVLGVVHGDEQDIGLDVGLRIGEETLLTWRFITFSEDGGLTKLIIQQLFIFSGIQTAKKLEIM